DDGIGTRRDVLAAGEGASGDGGHPQHGEVIARDETGARVLRFVARGGAVRTVCTGRTGRTGRARNACDAYIEASRAAGRVESRQHMIAVAQVGIERV